MNISYEKDMLNETGSMAITQVFWASNQVTQRANLLMQSYVCKASLNPERANHLSLDAIKTHL